MPNYIANLRQTVEQAAEVLYQMSPKASAQRPRPGKWSPREIIGHLIDSASNNHQRFVRAQFKDDLIFPGYNQDDWVRVQHYQTTDWPTLVQLWRTFNLHLTHVMATIPESIRTRPCHKHNLDVRAFRPIPASEPATLNYFMEDYVHHLEHHLQQIEYLNET
jgi:hypothetical protein